jgi:hypothetical protein
MGVGAMIGDARELLARFIPDGDVGRFADELINRLRDASAKRCPLCVTEHLNLGPCRPPRTDC